MKTTVNLLASLSALLVTTCACAQHGMGDNFSLEKYNKAELANFRGLGFSDIIPSSYSMRMYAPYPGNQGDYGTCVGWGTTYGALTTQNAKQLGWTDRNKITALAFDPFFTYTQLKHEGDWSCTAGSDSYDALALIRTVGAKRYLANRYDCGIEVEPAAIMSGRIHRIKGFKRLFDYPDGFQMKDLYRTKIDKAGPVKKALGNGHVVVISTKVPYSFNWPTDGFWELPYSERSTVHDTIIDGILRFYADGQEVGGHAMCVVGYDDNKHGGAFEIMNSWGEDWGDGGFVWVTYDDFNWLCRAAYYFELFDDPLPQTGCVTGDCENGYGRYVFPSGSMYEGNWSGGQYNGYGIYVWADGSSYAGQWKDDQRHGRGTSMSTTRIESVDYWDAGSIVGYEVTSTSAESGCITGDCVDGYGTYKYGNGTYTGYFSNGYRSGYGTYIFSETGNSASGFWERGKMDGVGKFTWPSGYYFVGEYTLDSKSGYGIEFGNQEIYAAGQWFLNEFQYDASNGTPSHKITSWPTTAGKICESGNCDDGHGTVRYGNGDSYTGYFRKGLRHGAGTYSSVDGWSYKGIWADDVYDGVGRFTWADGAYYVGEFRKGRQDGYGIEVGSDYHAGGVWEFGAYMPGTTALGFGDGKKERPKVVETEAEPDPKVAQWMRTASAMKPETR